MSVYGTVWEIWQGARSEACFSFISKQPQKFPPSQHSYI